MRTGYSTQHTSHYTGKCNFVIYTRSLTIHVQNPSTYCLNLKIRSPQDAVTKVSTAYLKPDKNKDHETGELGVLAEAPRGEED